MTIALLLVLVAAAGYTLTVVIMAEDKTRAAIDLAASLENNGLTPDDLSDAWLADLLTVEDPEFFAHNGVDLSTPGAGLTTITQGLVKIHYFDDFKPGFAKIKQTILAWVADSKLSKREQLVLLLNTARMGSSDGQPVVGFGAAAQAYFGKDFASLSHEEYLSLVAMLVGPTQFNLATAPGANAERVRRIQALLAGACAPQDLTDVYYETCAGLAVPR